MLLNGTEDLLPPPIWWLESITYSYSSLFIQQLTKSLIFQNSYLKKGIPILHSDGVSLGYAISLLFVCVWPLGPPLILSMKGLQHCFTLHSCSPADIYYMSTLCWHVFFNSFYFLGLWMEHMFSSNFLNFQENFQNTVPVSFSLPPSSFWASLTAQGERMQAFKKPSLVKLLFFPPITFALYYLRNLPPIFLVWVIGFLNSWIVQSVFFSIWLLCFLTLSVCPRLALTFWLTKYIARTPVLTLACPLYWLHSACPDFCLCDYVSR